MDTLDRIAPAAGPLLARVDEIVEYAGAPAGHPLWTQLRRVRLLPGDAVEAVAALRPDDIAAAAGPLRATRDTLADVASTLPAPGAWAGTAADAYATGRRALSTHVDALAGRAATTADLGDDLAEWMRGTRRAVAAVLADVLASAESAALPLTGAGPAELLPPDQHGAAAEVATRVLRTVADAFAAAEPLLDRTTTLSAQSPPPPAI
ncbi:hypothetical protein [Spirilliplanes yamanashiensis]|uniref:Uncharacterized protein n=1 Tax=Spirilliplanes yamanashiensis TaxID=42233 RepID=A0A8J4DJW4_9ACTN|nr:hypothetical protein [Spirilliplanes yamanashiensis]MDP9815480.1 hypothetical protein [Spirilliplanes yamanashiensis]GIJ03734.1 hypothetical protein Sya03_30860 [Spirilliplanes yamanashiensis]